jgi:hypothetical protein
MTDAFLDDLVRRLRAGEDPAQVQRTLLDPGRQEILRRCAVPRTFDRAIFDTVLRDPDGPSLEGLVADGYVERVPGPEKLFRLRGEVREEWLGQWPTGPEDRVPPGVARLSGRLAEAYQANGDELEELYHRAVADPGGAVSLADRLFDEADERFDLAACQDVLDTLSEQGRLQWLGPDLAELRADRHAYLRARSYWSTEWLQSARYLNRTSPDRRLKALITDDGPRALQLHARGGSGKTMQLRWFIARWCVPKPRRIPCARIDFDLASPAAAGQRPWLLLLELADQLNRQLPAAPFQELLNDRGVLRALLDLQPSRAILSATGQLGTDPRLVAEEVTDRFVRTLAETAGDRPVLLVFDTFEQVLLNPEGNPGAILRLLDEVRRRCPSVRLLVAGRYDLRERVAGLDEILPGLPSAEVHPFSDKECRSYLRRRGLGRSGGDPDLIEAMVGKCHGDPFVLALLADLARDKQGLTAAEVRAYDDPQTLYLVERIVARVDDPVVRWLLRYGVVPRRLSREFAADVMSPYLRAGMAGTSDVDRPRADQLPEGVAGTLFPTDVLPSAEAQLDLDAVWQRLLQYAGDSSWVSLRAEHPGAVVFHPDLVTPMRRVLRRQPVFLELHRAAADYCARRADQGPEGWLPWTLEAVYHRFQAGATDADVAWQQALDVAVVRGGPQFRSRVADELLGPDYVDESGAPLPFDDRTPIVGWNLLARAHFERARALSLRAERATLGAVQPLAEQALLELRHVERIVDEHGWADAPTTAIALLISTLERNLGSARSTQRAAELMLLAAKGETADRSELTEVVADELRDRQPSRAAELYADVLADLPRESAAASRVGRKLFALLADQDSLDAALDVVVSLPGEGHQNDEDARALIEQGRVWLRAGRPEGLLRRVAQAVPGGPAMDAARDWCVASAQLAQHEPFAALRTCETAMRRQNRSPNVAQLRFNLELAELHAGINATLLKLNEAYAELEYVTSGWREIGETERSWTSAGAPADFDLRGGATLRRHAEYLLFGSQDAEEEVGGEGWFRRRLSALRVAIEMDQPDREILLRRTTEALGPDLIPHRAVQLGLVTLAIDAGDGVRMLLDGLRRMDSAPARLTLLEPLRRCTTVPTTPEQRAELLDLIGPPPPAYEHAAPLLAWVEFQRVFGRREDAIEALREVSRCWANSSDGREHNFRRWLVLDAADRLGADEALRPLPDDNRFIPDESTPVLAAATVVLWALRNPGDRSVEDWLDRAQGFLSAGGASGSEWEAHLQIGRALAALSAGNIRRCQQYTYQAEQTWARIRPNLPLPHLDRLAAVPGLNDEPAPSEIVRPFTDWSPTQVVYRLAWDRDALIATTLGPGRTAARVLDEFGQLLARKSSEPLSAKLDRLVTELLADDDRFVRRMGELVRDLPEFGATPDRPAELAVQTDSTFIGAIPWELMLSAEPVFQHPVIGSFTRVLRDSLTATHTIAALQRGLRAALGGTLGVDGLSGPETMSALRDFQRMANLPPRLDAGAWRTLLSAASHGLSGPPEVLVLRASTSRELSHGRGGLSEGVDIAKLYERHGFAVTTTSNASPGELGEVIRRTTRRGRFAVLHVAGGFGGTRNEVYVEFTSDREVADLEKLIGQGLSSALFGTTFDRAFASLPPELPRPLVILDPGRPRGESEAIRQLVLRNAFAHHLLELGNIPTVLAMGLDLNHQYECRSDLVRQLADGRTADEVTRRLRQLNVVEDRLARSVALSTHLPPYAMQRWSTA